MNYLAHAYLSFGKEEILLGNMSSDFIKGKQKLAYSINIQKGITLHRAIDTFTDAHVATKQARLFFKPAVGLYSGAFVDVVYDHFLAIDTNEFINELALQNFANTTYSQLQNNIEQLPERFKKMLPYMMSQNWLYNYQFSWGIQKSFEGVARRAVYLENANKVFIAFEDNYIALQNCYHQFFGDVKSFAWQQFQALQND